MKHVPSHDIILCVILSQNVLPPWALLSIVKLLQEL